jgi:hypothetical protein
MIHSRIPEGRDRSATIGLVADTHCHAGQIALPDAALEVLRGVDLILHLGDMGEAEVLDRLARVAPVLATRGGDDPASDPRIADEGRLLIARELALVAAFELGQLVPGAKSEGNALPAERIDSLLRTRAKRDVHAVVYAATHSPALFVRDGVLFVNPGSATLPATRGPSGLGTVARLTLCDRSLHAEIVQL